MGRLADKVAVVTGAAQGIGRAAAVLFLAEGATVWAVDRNRDALDILAEEHPRLQPALIDVTVTDDVAALAERADGADVLFNCAGAVPEGSILECTDEQWLAAFDANVTSMYRVTRVLLPGMLERGGGSIINMSSVVSSVTGVPNRFAYGTTKAAVVGFTKAVAADFVDRGIRCNAIAPGTIDTPSFRDRAGGGDDSEAGLSAYVARQPMGRLGTPAEIAGLALYLASDESAFTTGSIFVADGGMSL